MCDTFWPYLQNVYWNVQISCAYPGVEVFHALNLKACGVQTNTKGIQLLGLLFMCGASHMFNNARFQHNQLFLIVFYSSPINMKCSKNANFHFDICPQCPCKWRKTHVRIHTACTVYIWYRFFSDPKQVISKDAGNAVCLRFDRGKDRICWKVNRSVFLSVSSLSFISPVVFDWLDECVLWCD